MNKCDHTRNQRYIEYRPNGNVKSITRKCSDCGQLLWKVGDMGSTFSRFDILAITLFLVFWITLASQLMLPRDQFVGIRLSDHSRYTKTSSFSNLIGDFDLKSFPKIKTNQPIHWKLADYGKTWITNSEGRVFELIEADASLEDVVHEAPDGQKYTLFMAPRDRPADPPFPAWRRGQIFTNWIKGEGGGTFGYDTNRKGWTNQADGYFVPSAGITNISIMPSSSVSNWPFMPSSPTYPPSTLLDLQRAGKSYAQLKRSTNGVKFISADDSCSLFDIRNMDKLTCDTNNQAYISTQFEPIVTVLLSGDLPTRYEIRFKVK